jgi:SulP family sulfate permease
LKAKIAQKIFPFLDWWPSVTKATVKADLSAGITNAVIVLPQGVAFAMIAGLPPIYGLYTAIIAPIVTALFGSSYHLISGPNTPVSLIFFATLSVYAEPNSLTFIELAFVLTFISGVLQFLMGIIRIGSLVNFVSSSVIVGFTAGAALLIMTSQAKHLFGLPAPSGASFIESWQYIITHIGETNLYVLGIALSTLISAILFKKLTKYISWLPHLLLAMVVGSLVAYYGAAGAEGIKLVGELPSKLPSFHWPHFTTENIIMLTPSAFAVALLGLIQAISIARAIAVKSQQQLDSNQEFISEGLSNIVGGMMMCYASSGSFTRSGINYDAGAKTPMSAIFAALSLALILLFVAPLTAYLPIAAMAGIILMVAYSLIDFKLIASYARTSKSEFGVLIVTALSTLFLELQFAIYIGVILSLGLYLKKTSKPRIVKLAPNSKLSGRHMQNIKLYNLDPCPQFTILRIDGSIFFGAVEHISKKISKPLDSGIKHVLIVAQGVNFVDIPGADMLINQAIKYQKAGGALYISGMKKNVRDIFKKGKYYDRFGRDNIFVNKEEAISEIYQRLDKDICKDCKVRIFKECEEEFGKSSSH